VTDRVVVGGRVVAATGSRPADVAIRDGRISAVGENLPTDGADVIDATGLLILPGVVDVHTHLRLADDDHPDRFAKDLAAAAAGGTTTVLTFNNPGTGISDAGSRSLLAGLDEFRSRTAGQMPIDVGLCAVITNGQPDAIDEIPQLIRRGVPSAKAFMVYDFALPADQLPEVLAAMASNGGLLQLHCEDPATIDPLVTAALAAGDIGPRHHAVTRPTRAEGRAVRAAIELARRAEAPLYLVHLSCEEEVDAVAEAKARGEPIFAETCPHYLTLTADLYDDPDDAEVMKRVISPPLRTARDVEALWAALRDGILDVVGSDHVPDRLDTEKSIPAPPFPEISNGGPGIETLLSVVYDAGVAEGRIGVERLVDVLATTPARLFGLPSKGAVETGRDADLVLWDPGATRVLRQDGLHHTSDYTPYEGRAVRGAPRVVLSRGAAPSLRAGRFLERVSFAR
jgi:dihydropyrimidinase